MPEHKFIRFEIQEGVANITFDRPKHNVFNIDMLNELNSVLEGLTQDTEIKCVVFMAAGPSWCAGVDVGDHKPELVDKMISHLTGYSNLQRNWRFRQLLPYMAHASEAEWKRP